MSPIAAMLAATSTLSTTSPSITAALYNPPNAQGPAGTTLHVLSTGGVFLFAATIVSFTGYFYHAKRRSKTSGSTLRNMFVPRVRNWRPSTSTHTTSDPDGGSSRVFNPDVTPSVNAARDTEFLTGERPGHVSINMGQPLVTTVSTGTFSMGSSEKTAPIGKVGNQSDGVAVSKTTKTLLDTIREEDEEDDASVVIDETSQGTLTATFPLAECMARIGEANLSGTRVDACSSFFDVDDEDEDAKSEYSTDSASPEHHSPGTPLITLTEALHVPQYDVARKSYEFSIGIIGATIRDGPYLANPDLLDDWFPPQTFVAPSLPAPSTPTSSHPALPSISSSRARRYGMADMSQFAKALATVEENVTDSLVCIEEARASSLATCDRRGSQLDVTKYTETLTLGTCRPACEPKLDMIQEDEEDEVSSREGPDTPDLPSAAPMMDPVSNQAEGLEVVSTCSESQSDADGNLGYSSCAESVEELDSLLDSLSESEVEFPAAVKPEMDVMFKILQAFRDEQFEWSPRSFTSDSEDSDDSDDSDDDKSRTEIAAAPATPPGRLRSKFTPSYASSESESDEEVVIMPLTPPTSPPVRAISPLMIKKRNGSQGPHEFGGYEEQTLQLAVRPSLVPRKPFVRGHRHTRSVFELPITVIDM